MEINKDYLYPNFIYNIDMTEKNNEDYFFLRNLKKLKSENKFALNSIKREIKLAANAINKSKNKYNIFCIKTINYLNSENCIKDFKEPVQDENLILYQYLKYFKTIKDEQIKHSIKVIRNFVILSMYINQYKYLFNLFTYEEIKEILDKELSNNNFSQLENKVVLICEELIEKIKKNESIIELKEQLKEVQKYFILLIMRNIAEIKKLDFFNYYQTINFLRDFDFCSKMWGFYILTKFNNKNHNFFEEIISCLNYDRFFVYYVSYLEQDTTKINKENIQNITKNKRFFNNWK